MRGNSFGEFFVVTSFGESHGPALGAVVDGCPAGIQISSEDFSAALQRRRPGLTAITSSRAEPDAPEILSGIFEGRTLGTPIAVLVRNSDARSGEYRASEYRAGHADAVWEQKFGVRDFRGGGRTSGRETIARVIGGAVAEKLLPCDLRIVAFAKQIGPTVAHHIPELLTREQVDAHDTRCPDAQAAELMRADLLKCAEEGDSRGGIIEIRVDGVPRGLGEPVFRKTKALIAAALMSVGAVTGVESGDGFADASLSGRAYHNGDDETGVSVRAAGIQGGITNGERLLFRVAIKPVSTIGAMALRGRHDPCIIPRVIPVLEAMTALSLADLYLARLLDTHTEK